MKVLHGIPNAAKPSGPTRAVVSPSEQPARPGHSFAVCDLPSESGEPVQPSPELAKSQGVPFTPFQRSRCRRRRELEGGAQDGDNGGRWRPGPTKEESAPSWPAV
jgi:hypothetical protein